KEAAGSSSMYGNPICCGIALGNEITCARKKVGEAILFVGQFTFLVPGPSLVRPTADVGSCVDKATVHQAETIELKGRRHGQTVGAIAVEKERCSTVDGCVLLAQKGDLSQLSIRRWRKVSLRDIS